MHVKGPYLDRRHPGAGRRRRGFTLMEMLVSFLMLVILLVAVLVIFERSARIGRDQTEISAIQQASRIAHSELLRHARMAGAGGLPLTWKNMPAIGTPLRTDSPGAFPNGFAVSVRNDVPENFSLPVGGGARHPVIPHSDILTLRGAFTLPVYFYYPAMQTISTDPDDHWPNGDTNIPVRALEIPNRIGQDFRTPLAPLLEHLNQARNRDKVLFLVRDLMNPDNYGVLKWNTSSALNRLSLADCTTVDKAVGTQGAFDVGCIVVAVELQPAERYAKLLAGTGLLPSATPSASLITLQVPGIPRNMAAFPAQFGSIAVIQEYRYYLRADFEVPGDPTSRLSPVLTRAEYLPSLELDPNEADFIEAIDVVDNLIDLQIAVGVDQDYLTTATGHGVVTDDGSSTDEIIFNDPADFPANSVPPGLTRFNGLGVPDYVRWFHPKLDVYFLRLTTVAQSQRPDRDFVGAGIGRVEDCDRTANFMIGGQTYNYNNDRKYRRRLLQSVAELRNLK